MSLGAPSSPGLSLPVGTRGTLRAQAGAGRGPRRQGPGGSGTAHCGGPGPPGPAEAVRRAPPPGRGSRRRQLAAPQLQPQHLPRPDGAGGRGPAVRPPSGCSLGAGGGARADPEPSRRPSLARVRAAAGRGRPWQRASARQVRVRAGGASLQVRARSRRRKVLGGTAGPYAPGLRLRELQIACPRGFLRAALRRALRLHHRPLVTRARLQS